MGLMYADVVVTAPKMTELANVLRTNATHVIDTVCERYSASSIRIPTAVNAQVIANLAAQVVESLASVLPLEDEATAAATPMVFKPGSTTLRELEKSVSFVGSVMESSGSAAFDVAALITAVRDVAMRESDDDLRIDELFQWLVIIAMDSFGVAARMSERERQAEYLSRGTPVVLITPNLPAVLLVGQPNAAVLDAIFARLVLAIVRTGAEVVILDVNGLFDKKSETVLLAVSKLLKHQVFTPVDVLVVGLDEQQQFDWESFCGFEAFEFEVAFDLAVTTAFEKLGMRVV